MTRQAEVNGGGAGWRILGWGLAAVLLLVPAIAMRFTTEVNWTASDFIIAAVMIGSLGIGVELAMGRSPNGAYRAGAGVALVTAFLTIWVNLAVGMIGSEDNRYNLVFVGLVVASGLGSLAVRCRSAGMSRTMFVIAALQVVAAAGGVPQDQRGGALSMAFALPWVISGILFGRAARSVA